MNDTSPILAMPYIQPSQAQKHVTHNEALSLLDVIVQLAVLSADQNMPPNTVVEGERHLVAPTGQGAWAGHDHEIAVFDGTGWAFTVPKTGWVAQVVDSGSEVIFDGTAWIKKVFSNLPGVGIGADFDAYNRLVVSSDAVLLNNAGTGHQLKINKNAEGDTASLLFQTGYGGRAELGTSGSDDFSLKVSSDGGSWTEALRVDAATGRVSVGVAGWREMLTAPRTYYVDPALGDDAGAGLAIEAGAFATIARALEAVHGVDSGGNDVTVQLADSTYTVPQVLQFDRGLVGQGNLILQGNSTNPDQVTIEAVDEVISITAGTLLLRGVLLQNASTVAPAISVEPRGSLALDQVVFGPAGGHVRVDGGHLTLAGGYAITGGATYHMKIARAGSYDANTQDVTLSGAPDFSDAFMICEEVSVARVGGQNFSGSATGLRYRALANSVIQSGGTVLPGDIAGTTQSGGLYL